MKKETGSLVGVVVMLVILIVVATWLYFVI
jgi:hypothetical protein